MEKLGSDPGPRRTRSRCEENGRTRTVEETRSRPRAGHRVPFRAGKRHHANQFRAWRGSHKTCSDNGRSAFCKSLLVVADQSCHSRLLSKSKAMNGLLSSPPQRRTVNREARGAFLGEGGPDRASEAPHGTTRQVSGPVRLASSDESFAPTNHRSKVHSSADRKSLAWPYRGNMLE